MFKLALKFVGAAAALGVLAVAGAYTWFFLVLPRDIPAPDIAIEATPERIARGDYLANAVYGCIYCHSERDWTLFGGPPVPGRIGAGGEIFDQSVGLSGMIVSPNITPAGIGDWTDGEVYRAIVNGLHKDGYAFFPIMPFDVYLYLPEEDIYSIIAYIRTLETVTSVLPERNPSMMMQFIGNVRALPYDPWEIDASDPVQRGERTAVIAGCRFCHTPADERARPLPGMRLAGGLGMVANGTTVYSANITPDPETGIGSWSKADFVARFKAFEGAHYPVESIGYQSQHAWTEYAQMSEADLTDIYAYLMVQAPVKQLVDPIYGVVRQDNRRDQDTKE